VLYFQSANLTLLATPKNASTSLHAALRGDASVIFRGTPKLKHIRFRRYRRHLEPLLTADAGAVPDSMALIREPIGWLASWHSYRARPGIADPAASTAGISFADFVESYLSPASPPYARLGSQARFLTDEDDGATVTHLFRLEDLPSAVAFLAARLGRPVALDHLNMSAGTATPDLPADLLARLVERCAQDYALWEMAGRSRPLP
jgi:hypothetical protein